MANNNKIHNTICVSFPFHSFVCSLHLGSMSELCILYFIIRRSLWYDLLNVKNQHSTSIRQIETRLIEFAMRHPPSIYYLHKQDYRFWFLVWLWFWHRLRHWHFYSNNEFSHVAGKDNDGVNCCLLIFKFLIQCRSRE